MRSPLGIVLQERNLSSTFPCGYEATVHTPIEVERVVRQYGLLAGSDTASYRVGLIENTLQLFPPKIV